MNLQELRERRSKISNKSSETISSMKEIINQSYNMADRIHNEILNKNLSVEEMDKIIQSL